MVFNIRGVARMYRSFRLTLPALVVAMTSCPAVSVYGQQSPPTVTIPPVAAQPDNRPVRQLSLDDAVAQALEQNLGIQVERLNPQIQDLDVAEARSAYTPYVATSLFTHSVDSPVNSFLSGGQDRVSDDQFGANVNVNQALPWGATYALNWDSSRATTNNLFSNFDPTLRTGLDFRYTQPLLRNFRVDSYRQQVLLSRKNREISDVDLQQTLASTLRDVRNAYWDLSYSVHSLEVQQTSLGLARELLRNNRSRVEIGTMAPIDIVEAEAEVARREEAVIVAEGAISQTEDRLKALVFDPSMADFWNMRLELTDRPSVEVRPIDLDAAVRNALDRRSDIRLAKKQIEATDLNIRYYRDQRLPDVNAQFDYALTGLGGTRFVRGEGFPGPIIGRVDRGFGSVLGDLFENSFPDWTLSLTVGYPIGGSSAEANLARARLEQTQTERQVRNLELQAATEVREAGRQVMTNQKRVDASRVARQLAERRLEAEEKKFAAGLSTSFFVFQAQRDLAAARNDELRAWLDYAKSLTDFDTVQEVPLGGGTAIGARAGGSSVGTTNFGASGAAQSPTATQP
jgi:outer membrane protein TolC